MALPPLKTERCSDTAVIEAKNTFCRWSSKDLGFKSLFVPPLSPSGETSLSCLPLQQIPASSTVRVTG